MSPLVIYSGAVNGLTHQRWCIVLEGIKAESCLCKKGLVNPLLLHVHHPFIMPFSMSELPSFSPTVLDESFSDPLGPESQLFTDEHHEDKDTSYDDG